MFTSTKETTDKVTKIVKIKNHIKNHKRDYTIAAASAAATVVITSIAVALTGGDTTNAEQLIVQKNYFGKSRNVVINLEERSTPSTPIHEIGTDLYFASIHDAARKTGLDRTAISKNINGITPHVRGRQFEELIPA